MPSVEASMIKFDSKVVKKVGGWFTVGGGALTVTFAARNCAVYPPAAVTEK